jgi:hypothetical protein
VAATRVEKVGSVLRNVTWADVTSPVGWAVSGLWNNHHYNFNSNSEEAVIGGLHVNNNRSLTAAVDTAGWLRLFRYPAPSAKAQFQAANKAVSGPLAAVRFFYEDSAVLAVGGEQGAVFKWKLK